MTMETVAMDEFDGLLADVLRSVGNPEMPDGLRRKVERRFWVGSEVRDMREAAIPTSDLKRSDMQHPGGVVFSPAEFQVRMAPARDARSTAAAVLVHVAALALIFWGVAAHVQSAAPAKSAVLTELTPPPVAPVRATAMGGGGGQRGPAPVSKGELPKFTDRQITPPKALPAEEPKIRMPEATIEVQKDLKMANANMPNMGMPNSPLLGASMGNGSGTGIGAGSGAGLGVGSGGNYGGGVKKIGGGVSAPVLMYSVEPEFSEEARKAKTSGNVLVNLIVDAEGRPQRVRVLRGVGMGLDEKAIAAVKQYKFKPAMEAGKPVTVELNVEVNFQIF